MEYVKKYLQEILGINVQIRQVTPKRAGELPLFIRQIYDFYSMTLFGRKILLLKKHSDATISVAQMQKHTQLAEETFDLPAVLVLPFLESYNRKRLIQKRVAFRADFMEKAYAILDETQKVEFVQNMREMIDKKAK